METNSFQKSSHIRKGARVSTTLFYSVSFECADPRNNNLSCKNNVLLVKSIYLTLVRTQYVWTHNHLFKISACSATLRLSLPIHPKCKIYRQIRLLWWWQKLGAWSNILRGSSQNDITLFSQVCNVDGCHTVSLR